jgi:endonuclease/exonuclease/phosphatase (EEP) superfamily protein YafD
MAMKKYFLILPLLFVSTPSWAQRSIPPEDQVLIRLSPSTAQIKKPNQFRVLVWNIQKAQAKNAWARDYENLVKSADLVLLQEGMRDSFVPGVLNRASKKSYWMAQSFLDKGGSESTGVVTGSWTEATQKSWLRSPGREPISNTPKMTLLTVYDLENGEKLLVMNIHAINFVGVAEFEAQIKPLAKIIKEFQGKVLFAGDFNTWNQARFNVLDRWTQFAGLQKVSLSGDTRNLKLDHIYLRGCTADRAGVLNRVRSSDHYPLFAEVRCL